HTTLFRSCPGWDRISPGEVRGALHVDAVLRAGVDHAVVGGDVEDGVGGQDGGELLGEPVHLAEVVPPVRGVHAVQVPEQVELGVVDEAVGAVGGGEGGFRADHPIGGGAGRE